jgi:hypothetical protein
VREAAKRVSEDRAVDREAKRKQTITSALKLANCKKKLRALQQKKKQLDDVDHLQRNEDEQETHHIRQDMYRRRLDTAARELQLAGDNLDPPPLEEDAFLDGIEKQLDHSSDDVRGVVLRCAGSHGDELDGGPKKKSRVLNLDKEDICDHEPEHEGLLEEWLHDLLPGDGQQDIGMDSQDPQQEGGHGDTPMSRTELLDMVDLAELGGQQSWPPGMNLERAKLIVARMTQQEAEEKYRETASGVAEIRGGAACIPRRGVTNHTDAAEMESALPGCVVPTHAERTCEDTNSVNVIDEGCGLAGSLKNSAGSKSAARRDEHIGSGEAEPNKRCRITVADEAGDLGTELQEAMFSKPSRAGERKRQLENKRRRDAEVEARPIMEQETEDMTDAQRRTTRLLAKIRRKQS